MILWSVELVHLVTLSHHSNQQCWYVNWQKIKPEVLTKLIISTNISTKNWAYCTWLSTAFPQVLFFEFDWF